VLSFFCYNFKKTVDRILNSLGQVKQTKNQGCLNGLTTQSDKKIVLLNFKSGGQNPLKKTGRFPKSHTSYFAYSTQAYEQINKNGHQRIQNEFARCRN